MSIIHLLDNINYDKKEQIIRLQKTNQLSIKIKIIRYIESKCDHCNDEDVITYLFDMTDQLINNQLVSTKFTITKSKIESNQIHYFTITDVSSNVADVKYTYYFQTIALLNLFMNHYYNTRQYIEQENCHKQDYSIKMKNNVLTSNEHGEINNIKIINKRLFKNLIVIIKCIVDHIQKN